MTYLASRTSAKQPAARGAALEVPSKSTLQFGEPCIVPTSAVIYVTWHKNILFITAHAQLLTRSLEKETYDGDVGFIIARLARRFVTSAGENTGHCRRASLGEVCTQAFVIDAADSNRVDASNVVVCVTIVVVTSISGCPGENATLASAALKPIKVSFKHVKIRWNFMGGYT